MLDETDLTPKLFENYRQFSALLTEIEDTEDRPYLACEDVLDAHYLICEHFFQLGEGIAGFGPKDFGLLSSAIGRQWASAGGMFVYDDYWDIAASVIFGLISDHPFHDGNKRTAFLSTVFFMAEHGYAPAVDMVALEDFTVEIAEHKQTTGRYLEVPDIAARLKTMFRTDNAPMPNRVTFNDLQAILNQHGFSLENPNGNRIDVHMGGQPVSQIDFAGWSQTVSRHAISTVRKSTGLREVDAEELFNGADPLKTLIQTYEEPLRRLAFR